MTDVQTITVPPEDVPGSFGRQVRGEPPIVPQPPEQPNSPQALRTFEEGQSALSRQSSALSREYANIPKQPTQLDVSKAPDQRDYQKGSMEFAQAMALVGAFTSAFVRRPGGASLDAFAGAIKGWQTGNQQAYENSMKQWEQNTKATIENNRTVLNEYKLALENRQLNIDGMMAQIKLTAAKYQDKLMYDAASSGNYTLVGRIYDMQQKALGNVQKASDVIGERFATQTNANKELAQKWSPYVNQLDTLVNPQTGQPFSEAEKAAIRQLVETYGPDIYGGSKGKTLTPAQEALRRYIKEHPNATSEEIQKFNAQSRPPRSAAAMSLSKFLEENPEATAEDIQNFQARQVGKSAEERTGANVAANIDLIMRNAHAAIPMAIAASEKVPRTTWVPINRLVQTADANISDPALKEFKLANLQLAELWARAMNPRGVMRESDRELALGILSTADSPETYKRVVQQLENFLQRERKSVQEFREHREPEPTGGAKPTAPSPTSGDPLGIR
jgi:hypothetical protein